MIIRYISVIFLASHAPMTFAASVENPQETCLYDLTEYELPKALNISSQAVGYLIQNPEHRSLLESLSRIFVQVNTYQQEFYEIGQSVERPIENVDRVSALKRSNFFSMRPELLTPEVESTYDGLIGSIFDRKLSDEDLGLLAHLFAKIRRAPGRERTYAPDEAEKQRMRKMVETLVKSRQYAKAVMAILMTKDGQNRFIQTYAELFGNATFNNVPPSFVALRDILRDVSRQKVDSLTVERIRLFIMAFGNPIAEAIQEQKTSPHWLPRKDVLAFLPKFFGETVKVKSSMDDILDVIDNIFYGTAFPKSPAAIYGHVVDRAKTLILPLKAEYSNHAASLARAKQVSDKKETAPFEVKIADHFVPQGQRTYKSAEKPRADESVVQAIERQIDPQFSFREWTSYAEAPRILNSLKADQPYHFWFLREEDPLLRTVIIHDAALDWIKAHPREGLHFLNALHMGPARATKQPGTKILAVKSPYVKGPAFELKGSNGDRGILYHVNDVWHLTQIVPHEDVDHTVLTVDPKIKP